MSPEQQPSPLVAEYTALRAELQDLLAAPVKDLPRIDVIVDQLEKVQLAIKAEHGIQGNNPLE